MKARGSGLGSANENTVVKNVDGLAIHRGRILNWPDWPTAQSELEGRFGCDVRKCKRLFTELQCLTGKNSKSFLGGYLAAENSIERPTAFAIFSAISRDGICFPANTR